MNFLKFWGLVTIYLAGVLCWIWFGVGIILIDGDCGDERWKRIMVKYKTPIMLIHFTLWPSIYLYF